MLPFSVFCATAGMARAGVTLDGRGAGHQLAPCQAIGGCLVPYCVIGQDASLAWDRTTTILEIAGEAGDPATVHDQDVAGDV